MVGASTSGNMSPTKTAGGCAQSGSHGCLICGGPDDYRASRHVSGSRPEPATQEYAGNPQLSARPQSTRAREILINLHDLWCWAGRAMVVINIRARAR